MSAITVGGADADKVWENLGALPPARLNHKQRGVIGPSGRTCGSIAAFGANGQTARVVWEDQTEQIIDAGQTLVEFFVPTKIEYSRIDLEWNDLKAPYDRYDGALPPGSLILMTGLPGSGKTTLARHLSQFTRVLHLDFAIFAERVIGRYPLCQKDYSRVGERIDELVFKYLNGGRSLIYDTTAIEARIRQHHFAAIPIWSPRALVRVPTDSNQCRQRLALQRPFDAPDLRPHVTRASDAHVRTFDDFVTDYEVPLSSIVVPNDADLRDAARTIVEDLWRNK